MARLAVTVDGQQFEIEVSLTPACNEHCVLQVNGEYVEVLIPESTFPGPDIEWIIINGHPYELTADINLQWMRDYSGIHSVEIQDREGHAPRPRSGDGRIKAPIPGLVTRVLVQEGETVRAEQPIIVLEAMKMENEIRAPFDGKVRSLSVSPGESVVHNAILAEVS